MQIGKLLFVAAITSCLTGCIGVALLAGAGAGIAGANVVHDDRSVSQQYRDRTLSDKMSTLLMNDPQLARHAHIDVGVYNGTVLLVGQVQTPELKQHAEDVARQMNGVRRVYNELVINPSASFFSSVDDTWITTKVKSAMVARKELESSRIKVITENGVVYLMGEVSPDQAGLAADTARRVKGVVKVVEVFQ